MNPLFEKYFTGELTDSEETKLESLLTESQDAAWEFGQAAEEIYARYGLPEPELPRDPENGPRAGGVPWKWILPVILLFLLGGAWKWNSRPSLVPLKPVKAPEVKHSVRPAPKVPERPAPKEEKALTTVPVKPTEVPLKTLETPPGDIRSKLSGTDLQVVVRMNEAGPAGVRVVDEWGTEIRRLFSGTLQAGRWSFEWDGRAGNGSLVAPGKYRILVETQAGRQSKELTIR